MAERRMFAKTIIDSDAFLDMPLSAQALYFHLSMRADDEGFVNNPKKIQRMVNASDDDMKVLLAKNFIIIFESGVIVIKHWKIHNYIRGDRVIETKYQDEKALLEVKENGSYTVSADLKELQDFEQLDATDKRKMAYRESSLPYSFEYKIRMAFNGKKCPICGCEMKSSNSLTKPSIQHNKPISKGGKHEIDNISVICNSCNTSIGNKETEELNNAEVIEYWDRINVIEQKGIRWFLNPQILEEKQYCLPNVSQMSVKCQSSDSIGKVSIGKDSIDNNSIKDTIRPTETIGRIIEKWNTLKDLGIMPVMKIGEGTQRKKWLSARLKTYSEDDFMKAIENIRSSLFLQGHNKNGWVITFDWFVRPNNFPKVLEGNYNLGTNVKDGEIDARQNNEYGSHWTDHFFESK